MPGAEWFRARAWYAEHRWDRSGQRPVAVVARSQTRAGRLTFGEVR
jgi:hypothetical protein